MNILDRLLVICTMVSILGTITTTFLSVENSLQIIGFQEMKQMNNVSKIEVSNNYTYLFTSNDTDNILTHKYAIGNQELFGSSI